MNHRRNRASRRREESIFRLLFMLLLFLSVLRAIDLLPEANAPLLPAFSSATSAPTEAADGLHELPLYPESEPLAVRDVQVSVCSHCLDLRGHEPRILIYHTHTTEAYTATKESPYVRTSAYRTADASKSVLAVGEALADRLRTQYGFSVIHDTTNHEPPSLKTAYERSEQTMKRYLAQYPSLVLFIDVHRAASSDASDYVLVDGSPTARLMCVVGHGAKYQEKPDFDRNYTLASTLTDHLNHIEKRLARDVRVKTGRYNQHVGQLSLLIEVGHNANTLEQALHAVPFLAESLALTLAEMEEKSSDTNSVFDPSLPLVPSGAGIDKG